MSKNIEKENNLKPQDFISKNIGQIVDVKLQNEEVYQGILFKYVYEYRTTC